MFADEAALVCAGKKLNLDQLDSNGLLVDLETQYNLLRSRFNEFLASFFKEFCSHKCSWPLPPMLGDRNSVDLFKLYFLVRENGGYEVVTKNELWGFVTGECGLKLEQVSSVKLVYDKYLHVLEKCLASGLKDKNLENQSILSSLGLDSLVMGLETEFKGSLLDIPSSKKKSKEVLHLGPRPELSFSDDKNLSKVIVNHVADGQKNMNPSNVVVLEDDGKVKSAPTELNSDDDVMIIPSWPSDTWEEISNRKRKRKSLLGMLNWVMETAKDPCDAVVGSLPDKSKWKSYGNDEPWRQILLYRETVSRNTTTAVDSSPASQQKNQKPCLYDDRAGSSYNLRERLSCTKNPFSPQTTSLKPASNTESSSNELLEPYMEQMGSFFDDPSTMDSDDDGDVPLGRRYQADVPEWTGVVIPSDTQWLGTLVWPLPKDKRKKLIQKVPVGKGRPESCGCNLPGSVECVRLHVTEENFRLKLELGAAHRRWKLGKIGERVKRFWTPDDEKKFMDTKENNRASFWEEIHTVLPTKSRKKLVSYYFNVYLVNRRAYQNRHTPTEIESEDEEPEKPSEPESVVTTPLRHKVTKSPKSLLRSPGKSHKKIL